VTAPPEKPAPDRARRWILLGLFASLAVNIFLVGWLAASAFRAGPPHDGPRAGPPPPPPAAFRFMAARRELTPEQRREVDRLWRENRDEMRARGEALRQSRQTLQRVLTADQLDEAALAAALADLRQRSDAVAMLLGNQIAATARFLPAEARKKFFAVGFARPDGPPRRPPAGPAAPGGPGAPGSRP
jgi:uncharacterized membrane protein